ncbi:MAG: NAD(P)/FAD-dependent oxidoreductase [Eubacteriales bacterium]|jgi:thioredoxin reductase
MMERKQVIVIGGGPAGLAAAVELYRQGITDVLVLEREATLGGILRQCIHDGFGLTRFGESLSGPEYAHRFITQAQELGIPCLTNAAVTHISPERVVTAVTREGLRCWQADAVVLAMGCRERTRGALGIPGERPSGVFTAGVAQNYINLQNRMIGREVVILGSGDIGMIMARRLTLEGAHVQAVLEIQPYASGLPRNVEQCLRDYDIPLLLSHTVTDIHGGSRLTGVTVSQVDEKLQPIPGTETRYDCDTLILSVGLIPENELSRDAGVELDPHTQGALVDEWYQTGVPGIFSAGNVLHVHDLVDFVSLEAERLAAAVARFVTGKGLPACPIEVHCGNGVGHVVPQRISGTGEVTLSLRVRTPFREKQVAVRQQGRLVASQSLRKLLPAEMIQITLPADALSGQEDVEVTVE